MINFIRKLKVLFNARRNFVYFERRIHAAHKIRAVSWKSMEIHGQQQQYFIIHLCRICTKYLQDYCETLPKELSLRQTGSQRPAAG